MTHKQPLPPPPPTPIPHDSVAATMAQTGPMGHHGSSKDGCITRPPGCCLGLGVDQKVNRVSVAADSRSPPSLDFKTREQSIAYIRLRLQPTLVKRPPYLLLPSPPPPAPRSWYPVASDNDDEGAYISFVVSVRVAHELQVGTDLTSVVPIRLFSNAMNVICSAN